MTRPPRAGRLEISPSLNRTVIGTFPGLPDGLAGVRANEWLAAWGVARQMAGRPAVRRAVAGLDPPLGLPDPGAPGTPVTVAAGPWAVALDRLVEAGDEAGCLLADHLALALGALVATLVTGSAEARSSRPDWSESIWERWGSVRRIAVGGGLVSGSLGARMVAVAHTWLRERCLGVDLLLADDPQQLVLRGAASLLPEAGGVVLDCGSTTVKRAVVVAEVGGHRLGDRPPVAAPRGSGHEVVTALAEATAGLASEVPGSTALDLSMALATYVDATGQPYAGQLGPYAVLGDVDLCADLRSLLARTLGRPVAVRVTHDGAAALLGARTTDPTVDAAIVLGTSIGSGLA